MPPETTTSSSDADKFKPLDRQVRDMVSAITTRVGDLHKPHHHHHHSQQADEDEHGIRIITLAGTNTGATMRGDLDDSATVPQVGDPEPLGTYVNSNFQSVNNSIMLGSSYNTNDPGVHLDISDIFQPHHPHKPDKHAKRLGKKKDKEAFKSDQQTEHST